MLSISRIVNEHLIFNFIIDNNENNLFLIDNENEIEILNESFAREKKLKIVKLKKQKRVKLMLKNGFTFQTLKRTAIIELKIENHKKKLFCYLTKVDGFTFILKNGWLQKHNPTIDWNKKIMTFVRKCVDQKCLSQETIVRTIETREIEHETVENSQIKTLVKIDDESKTIEKNHDKINIQCLTSTRFLKTLKRSNHQMYCLYPKNKFERKLTRYQKRILCAAIFETIRQSDHEKFMRPKQSYSIEDLKRKVLEIYHNEIEMFNQVKVDELSPHRKKNHEINLIFEFESSFIKSYKSMSEQKLATVKKYLDEHLKKRFIRLNSFKTTVPVLFVRKPSDDLKFCVNYRKLNEIIEKNRYSIFLINETLTRFSKAWIFIKLDVIATFNKVKIKASQKWMIAFNTKYEQFKYLMLFFELYKVSSTFQSYVNGSFREFLDQFVTAYLDDILMYSDNERKHEQQIFKMLRKLRERNLHLNIDKCEFSMSEVKYLKMYIEKNDIKMNLEKIKTILKWKTSKSVKNVLFFLKFSNFYRRFIVEFFKKVKCLTELTKNEQYLISSKKKKTKYQEFRWTEKCQNAFEELKKVFTKISILTHYNLTLRTWIETDSSNYVIVEIFSQMHDEILKQITFFFRKMNSAKCNYMIYDKKLLTIINNFENWRPELTGTHERVKVLSDHQNLEYFMITKELNRRQIRWAELLSEFNFKIKFRPGKQGAKSDVLIRRSQDLPKGTEDERIEYQKQTMLRLDQLDKEIAQSLKLNVTNFSTEDPIECHDENVEETLESTKEPIDKTYMNDVTLKEIQNAKKRKDRKLSNVLLKKKIKVSMKDIKVQKKRIYHKKRLWISNSEKFQLHLFKKHHDSSMQKYSGYKAMYANMSENYYWINMKKTCRRYAINCSICRRAKAYNTQKQKLLISLLVFESKWIVLSMNFVMNLSKCRRRNRIYENILVIVNRLTKKRIYESMNFMRTEDLLKIMHRKIFICYELSSSIVNDREDQMIFKLWQKICKKYEIRKKLSSTHHSETDGQTENANKVMKNYLKAYVRYVQDDWIDFLLDAEFAVNNHENAFTELISFFVENDYYLKNRTESSKKYDRLTTRRAELVKTDKIITRQKSLRVFLKERLMTSQKNQKRHVNANKQSHPEYKVGDLVYVNAKIFFWENSLNR